MRKNKVEVLNSKKKKSKFFIYNGSALIALKLAHRHSTLKQTSQVKNPKWQEADQLALYKHSRGVEPGATWNKSS